jgi:DNA-binding NarL/FixJ family response regulator
MALETVPVIPSARPRIRVAVVDDNPGFRETLASLLGTEELVVVGAAESGTEAIDLVRNTEPDVVLMDVRMPVMNGIEATRLLKSTFPDVGIVALTGVDDQDAVREMLVAGASCYVLKDSDSDEIFHAIRQAPRSG